MSAIGSDASAGLGAALREARRKSGRTLRQLGEHLGVSAAFLCDVEHGRRGMSKLAEAAAFLGTTEAKLLDRSDVLTRREVAWINAHPELLKLLRMRRTNCTCPNCLVLRAR